MTPQSPPAGIIGLTSIHGNVGRLIEVGQWLNGSGFRQWEHAFVSLGGGRIAEAEPGGARAGLASEYRSVYWCHAIAALASPAQLQEIADAARKYTEPGPWGKGGVPYSFLDYLALAQHRLRIPGPGLEDYIKSTNHQICSQLCDQAEQDAGVHLFTDGRWTGDVTPMDLYNLDVRLGRARAGRPPRPRGTGR
jgi:hypothetical protein